MALALDGARPLSMGLGPSQKRTPQPEDIHVLLVDDERLSRTIVANLLRKCNYKVTTAEHGAEAMEILRSSPHGTFQLVLTDICMPQVNGIELLQLVKQDDSFRSVPVIMMSSIEQDETVLQCVQGGAEEYLVKPVTKKELQHIWQHVWRKQLATAATVPQVQPPLVPAAPMAAPAAAATQQAGATAAQPEASSSAEHSGAVLAAAVGGAAAAEAAQTPAQQQSQQQAQQQAGGAAQALPPAVAVGDFITSSAGLDKRVKLFGVAVALLQSCHAHAAPLLRLRPYWLGISAQGLRVIEERQHAAQLQGGVGADLRAILDSLYASPEERAAAAATTAGGGGLGHPAGVTMAADVFSLGALFVDLFMPCASMQERCTQLAGLQVGVLPAELSGVGAELAPLRDFVKALVHPEPRLRPMLAHVVRSGQLQEVYRMAALLPCWRARQVGAAAGQQQAVPSAVPQPQPAESTPSVTQPLPTNVEAGTAVAPAVAKAVAVGAATATAVAAPKPAAKVLPPTLVVASSPELDYGDLQQFLQLVRESRLAEAQALQQQLAAVDADVALVLSRAAPQQLERGAAAAVAVQRQQHGLEGQPGAKRQRTEWPQQQQQQQQAAAAEAMTSSIAPALQEQQERLEAVLPHLEDLFFAKRCSSDWMPSQLDSFAEDLDVLARRGGLKVKATLRTGDMASAMEMACCVAFDRDDQLFATVGVSRRIKLFDFNACLSGDSLVHYPVLQMATRSKLSSVSWNAYVQQRLVTADYEGLIQLWDAGAGGVELAHFDEHARRVWSVDFSKTDPTRFLSGSDDGTVRLWSMHNESSLLQLKAPANVCSVQFSPTESHLVAFGCANYKVYVHDLRQLLQPLGVISGPQRAVSYVRFMGGSHLVAASTDSTLRLWDLREVLGSAEKPAGEAAAVTAPQLCFQGHRNQRNFVGLSVTHDGYIACGSEDNQVHCYYRSLPFSVGCHQFASAASCGGGEGEGSSARPPFVSAVCWANRSRHLLAANSQGIVEVLQME